MQEIQFLTVESGDNQLIAAPSNGGGELHCLSGLAFVVNRNQRIHWRLSSGSYFKLHPGVVYRLDAKTRVALEVRPV
jgi:hypothetical protein